MLRTLLRRESLLLLAAALLVAGGIGGLQTLIYRYLHQLDCDGPGVRNHPACHSGTTLLLNGRISTLGPEPQIEALAIEQGIIRAIGSSEELKARYPDAAKIDLNGYRAYPGFFDVWVDLLDGGLGVARLNLHPANDLRRTFELLEAFIKSHPDDPWILGQGWSMTALAGQPLSCRMLDTVLSDRPLFLWRDDHQAAALNSAALKFLQIDDQTPDPPEGRIDRDRARIPTGVLEGAAAEEAFRRIMAALPDAFVKRALLSAQEHLLAAGVTRVATAPQADPGLLVDLGELYEAGLWRLRVDVRPQLLEASGLGFSLYRSPDPEVVAIGGPALTMDGPVSQHRAALSAPYPDGGASGPVRLEGSSLARALDRTAGSPPLLVAWGDRALEAVIDGLEASPEVARPLVSSLLWPDAAVKRAARRQVAPVITPVMALRSWPQLRSDLPDALARGLFRFQTLAQSGMTPVVGSGWPLNPASPLVQLQGAISNQDEQGEPVMPEWHVPELLSLEQAIAAYTRNPATVTGRGDRAGTLEVGRLADLVVLDRDLGSRSPLEFDTTQVVMTIVGGEVVWRREGGLQLRVEDRALKDSPGWRKVIARQHFLAVLLGMAVLVWPVLSLLLWTWRQRPRPKPLKVIAGGPSSGTEKRARER